RVTIICVWCESEFQVPPHLKKKRRFCSNPCAARWRDSVRPDRESHLRKLSTAGHLALKGKKRPDASARMKTNNPMSNPAAIAKMRKSKRGQTFLSRGGNGQL